MFNRTVPENRRPGGVAYMEVVATSGEPRFVPLRRTELRGDVIGPLGSFTVTHVYSYTRAQSEQVIEALYRFPLPGDATVTGVRVRFGEVTIEAALHEREQAEREYNTAKDEDRQAALLTREAPDIFTLRIAGLQPDQEVQVETAFVQLARAEGAGWTLRIPLTSGPRYSRSDEAGTKYADGQPLAVWRDPEHRFALRLSIAGAGRITSPTHTLAVAGGADAQQVSLADAEVIPDRDCVLAWQPAQQPDRPLVQVWSHTAGESDSQYTYFFALVAPPSLRPATVPAREAVLLVDHSGSMSGAKWAAADWTVKRFLAELRPADAFALGLFHNRTNWFARASQVATSSAVAAAIRFLDENRDSGGTELGVALEQALDLAPVKGAEMARHVLIVTDAQVTDHGRLIRLAEKEAARPGGRRISLVCIDAAPNSTLVWQLAERGGGTARFLTSSPEAEDITTALDEVLADWGEPALCGLRLEISRPGAEALGRRKLPGSPKGWSAIDLGDLPAGRPIWVCGRVAGAAEGLSYRVKVGERVLDAPAAEPAQALPAGSALRALFGARRIADLELLMGAGYSLPELDTELRRLGYDPGVLMNPAGKRRRIYAENVRRDAQPILRALLVREALAFGLVSAETAFVATRSEAGRPVQRQVVVANALPAGWEEGFTGAMRSIAQPGRPMQARFRSFDSISANAPLDYDLVPEASPPDDSEPDVSLSFLRAAAAPDPSSRPPGAAADQAGQVYDGVPDMSAGECVLYDGSIDRLPADALFTALEVAIIGSGGAPDAGLVLLLYVGDLSSPAARVRLADVVRLGGTRPLNVRRQAGQIVRVVLHDTNSAWAQGAPALRVALAYQGA